MSITNGYDTKTCQDRYNKFGSYLLDRRTGDERRVPNKRQSGEDGGQDMGVLLQNRQKMFSP